MSGNLNLFSKVCVMQPSPNGALGVATERGMMKLNPKIMLHDVFCMPRLNYNLISVAQLINELMCTITFLISFV